jgi:hypothetical protein
LLAPPTDRELAIHRVVLALHPRYIRGQFRIYMQIGGTRLAVADRRGPGQTGELGRDIHVRETRNSGLGRRALGMGMSVLISPLVAPGGDMKYHHKRKRYNCTSQSAFDRHRLSPLL